MLTDANFKVMSEAPATHTLTQESTHLDGDVLAFPASAAQEAFFYLERLSPNRPAFNIPVRLMLDGILDLSLLRAAFDSLAQRHEGLRTRFHEDDERLLQVIMPEITFPIPLTDLSHLFDSKLDAEVDRIGSSESRIPFDLCKGPLLRSSILRLGQDRHILQITIHHSIADGWSIGIMTNELAEFYNAALQAREPCLEPLTIQYPDYTVWQHEFLNSAAIESHLNFWKERLRNYVELELPTDRPRPEVKSWDGEMVTRALPPALIERTARLAREEGATMFQILLAAFKAVASRYTGLEDIAIGTPVTGRTRVELEPIIGTFINSVILRTDLSGDLSFRQLISRVRDTTNEALSHQDLPFEQVVKALQPRREGGRNPLFQINFTYEHEFVRPVSLGGAKLTVLPSTSPGAIFDLHFFIVERAGGWHASCEYACDLYGKDTPLRLLEHFETFLNAATADPDLLLSGIPIIPSAEMLLINSWSGSTRPYPSDKTVSELFLESARRHASRTAINYEGASISYFQLARAAILLSSRLAESGVQQGDKIALCAPSVPEMIAAQIAILLSGSVCVPLDSDYPIEHIRFMMRDSAAKLLLTTPSLASRLSSLGVEVVLLDPVPINVAAAIVDEFPSVASARDASHLFYTSGSAGTPKGVLVCHRGITRLAYSGLIEFTESDSFLQSAPISFDAAILEIWMPLLHGGRIVLTGEEGASLSRIARTVKEENVSCLWLTAGLFQAMVDEHLEDLMGLRYLLAGGDVLSPPHVRKAFEVLTTTKLVNGYGPTENTTFTCCHTITRKDLDRPTIPIGRPIRNTSVVILDERLRPVPVGIPGELVTGGDGLAVAYLDRPELTSESFITLEAIGRVYRTGDRCRWLSDGCIEFIGRRDDQVKIRGFRIELGEVELVIASHPAVRQCKLEVRGETADDKRIFAWVVAKDDRLSLGSLKAFLVERLPAHMRPDVITLLADLPLSTNGKIDTRSLPEPSLDHSSTESFTSEKPSGETEKRLAVLWHDLLGITGIGRDDDFFAIGGHSLMALRLFSRINREFGHVLPLSSLISHSNIRSLAALIESKALDVPAAGSDPIHQKCRFVALSKSESGTPLICIHGGDGGVIFYRGLANLLPNFRLHAIESLALSSSTAIKPSSIEDTAAAYIGHLLANHPKGPFRLVGYSFGGVVAHEMACLLEECGHQVEFLGLFDTHNPAADHRVYSLSERLGFFWKQNRGIPLPTRVVRLVKRVIEGLATNHRVHTEIRKAAAIGSAIAHDDLRRVQVHEENRRAMKAYRPRQFPGRVTLFKAITTSDKIQWPDDFGWGPFASKGLEIIPVPGRHLTLFEEPNLETLASTLESALRECHRDL